MVGWFDFRFWEAKGPQKLDQGCSTWGACPRPRPPSRASA